VAPHS